MSLAGCLNAAWMWKCGTEARAFARATQHVAAVQSRVLQAILWNNRDTEFGARHHFARQATPEEYQAGVPLSSYEDYAAAIGRIAAGAPNVLTRDPVLLLEPTSGTTTGEKLIPYVRSLRTQFQRAVAAWVADLFQRRPGVRKGRAYWSLSPALGARRRSPGGIPIGFDDDTAYLGSVEQIALRRVLAVAPELARIADVETFRYCTLLSLLRAEDLSFVSVWNPSFLTALLAPLSGWHERLCDDLRRGRITPPSPLLPHLLPRAKPLPRRAAALCAIFRSGANLPEMLAQVWPRLSLLSCWTDAAAARFADGLRSLFPDVEIQPKGLLATEGVVSFPLVDRPAPILAIRSHFFEFQEETGRGRCRLAHQLDHGGRYRVVLTTGGGLYRYRLQDEVEVAGFERQCPLLRFLGKSDRVSDLVGEKLAEAHVREALDRALAALALHPRFALLVPVVDRPPRYRLYLQGGTPATDVWHEPLVRRFQAGLEANPHYRYAVGLGQLGPLEIEILDPDAEPAERVYERRCRECGQKMGAIKPTALDGWTGWPELFRPLAGNQRRG